MDPTPSTPSPLSNLPVWIRPMTIGGVVDRSLKIYRQAFLAFLGVAIIVQVPAIISQSLMEGVQTGSPPKLTMLMFLFSILGGLLALWGTGAIIHLGSETFLGRPSGFRQAGAVGLKKMFSLILASILYGLVLIGPSVVIGVLVLGAESYLGKSGGLSENLLLISVLAAIGVIAIALYISLLISFSLYSQALVLEDKRGTKSLKRSRTLIRNRAERGFFKNNIWRLSVIYLVVLAFWGALYYAPMLPGVLVKMGSLAATSVPTWLDGVTQAFRIVGQVFVFPISILALTVFYYDIRIRGEGLDMELRASEINE